MVFMFANYVMLPRRGMAKRSIQIASVSFKNDKWMLL